MRVQLSDSLSLPMYLSTSTVLFFLLIKTLLVSLFSYLWESFFYKAKEPGPCLTARMWCSSCFDPTSICFKRLSIASMLDQSHVPFHNHPFPLLQCVLWCVLSRVQHSATPWTAACQAPLSMGFSQQEYWSGLPLSLPSELPYPGINPASPALTDRFLTTVPLGKTPIVSSFE